jgi:tetratricopeptide (TPR) repeat protein
LRRPALIAAAVVVAIAAAGLVFQEVPALRHDIAVANADAGDWDAADGPARAAAAMDPEIQSYNLTAGLTAAHAGDHAAAIGYFEAVLGTTELPEAWLDLAAEQWALGRQSDAVASLKRSLRVGWQRPVVAIAAGDLALRIGETAIAIDALSSGVTERPSFAGDPWWLLDPARAAALSTVVDAAISKAGPSSSWEIALVAGQPERARQLATALANPVIDDIIAGWTGEAAAVARMTDRCKATPLDVGLVAWCSRLTFRAGDVDAAVRFGSMADNVSSGASTLGAELRVNTGVPVGPIAGDAAFIWGTFTYRRPTPADLLVPGLVHLVVE